MKINPVLMCGIVAMSLNSAVVGAQENAPPEPPRRAIAQWDKVTITVEKKIGTNLAILHGNAGVDINHPDASGGRVAVLYGPDGILMVDDSNIEVHDKLLAAVRSLSTAPIKLVINSHAHSDHTGGNAFFARQGAVIVGQKNLRDEMNPNQVVHQPTPLDTASLPIVTYNYEPATKGKPALVIHLNGETVDVIPMMPSHMGGDSIVKFEKANAIYIEDFYRNFGYPFADQANGGSINGMFDAIDLMGELSNDNTLLVPGHGTLIHKKDLVPYRNMLKDLMAKTKAMIAQGKGLDDILAANITKPYDATTKGDDAASIKRFVTELYYENKGLPPVVNGRRVMRP